MSSRRPTREKPHIFVAVVAVAVVGTFVLRWWRSRRSRLSKRNLHRRIRAQSEMTAIVPRASRESHGRVKLVFEDENDVEVAIDLDLQGVEDAAELHELVVQMYESAGVRTTYSDVLALFYKSKSGQLVPVTEDTPLADVLAAGTLRLTRDNKSRSSRGRGSSARALTDMGPSSRQRLMDDDDDDDEGMMVLHNSLANQVTSTARPLLPTPGRGTSRNGGRRGGARKGGQAERAEEGRGGSDDDDDDDDDDADLIYRQHVRREAGRAGVAKSMAL